MILEAKLDIAQRKIALILGLLALLGVILPFVNSLQQQGRIDREIARMESRFQELVGKQLRKPEIVCRDGDKPLADSVVQVTRSSDTWYVIVVQNIGDGTATSLDIYAYLKDIPLAFIDDLSVYGSWKQCPCDEPTFKYKYLVGSYDHLSAKDVAYVELALRNCQDAFESPAMLKVFYGEPQPIKVPFTLVANRSPVP